MDKSTKTFIISSNGWFSYHNRTQMRGAFATAHLNGLNIGMKQSMITSDGSLLTGLLGMNICRQGIFPYGSAELEVKLNKTDLGHLALTLTEKMPSLSVGIQRQEENYSSNFNATFGLPNSCVGFGVTKYLDSGFNLKLNGQAGTSGFVAEIGAQKKISDFFGACFMIGVPYGARIEVQFNWQKDSDT